MLKPKPGGATLNLSIDKTTGKPSGLVAIEMHWTSMPVHRASKKFEEIWAWMEKCGLADWERVHSLARYFHPGYSIDPKTGNFEPERAKGAPVYLSMEAKKYEPRLVRALAPTIAASIPRGSRGTPPEYLKAILFVSAALACHESSRLHYSLQDKEGAETVARHLYWFERFSALWDCVAARKPANAELNQRKRVEAEERTAKLAAHVAQYLAKNKGASARSAAASFFKGGIEHPEFDRAYRRLLEYQKRS